ncbi:membrane fusion protein, multidrug efflux system [Trichlorobacter thiogenes]|uniref:Membrane fusion protein, multidrug efflux system n=1 Tax=Trichlorobacter thiogenes TaxID=115783 RepID=A0A1T4PLM2_9BACT|nr:efflux RND transporter periplasmic adaptor subunit [Trichlorobacter thiogenes]SJZ92463.1 membrane fusion protein, multidrug efflux system [Trichlorobacter thiogenes]
MKRIALLLFCFALLLFNLACSPVKEKPKAKPAIPVKTAQAVQKNVPVQIKGIGTIEAFSTVAIKAQVTGQISRIQVAEGSDVREGQLLVSIDPEPFLATLRQAEATLAKSQAQARFATDQARRYDGLVKEGIVTHDQYDQLRANAESLSAAVAADRAAVANAKIQLGYCSIRSPISGRTGTIALHAGNLVKANDLTILTVNQISPINVTFNLPEKRLAELKQAMAGGQLKVEAMIPQNPGAAETGSISFLDNAVNPATGTIKLKGLFANKARKLWPGQFADLVLTLASRQNAVVVPASAVQNGQQGEYVYVVTKDQKAELRQVVTAPATEGETVIEKGVASGETVVIDGQLRLTPGAVVTSEIPQVGGKQK